MAETTLVFSAVAAVVAGLVYAYVGIKLSARNVAGPAQLAHRAFLAWWFGLALNQFIGAIGDALYLTGNLPIAVHQAIGQLSLLIVIVALWGLLYYLVFLYTGSSKSLVPLTTFYALFYLALVVFTLGAPQPAALADDGWDITTVDDTGATIQAFTGLALVAVLLFLLGPQLGAAVAFLSLYFRVDDPTQKYRILLVSSSILIWFGAPVVATVFDASGTGYTQTDAHNVFTRLLAIAASLTILMAYAPPKLLQKRFGVHSVTEDV